MENNNEIAIKLTLEEARLALICSNRRSFLRRSLPYIGIARNGQDDRTTYVIQKGLEAMRSGASNEEVVKVVAKAEKASDKTIQMYKALR